MAKGRGSIYIRGNLWTIDFTINGRRVREGISTNRRLAEMVLAKRMSEAVEGRYFNKRNQGRMPFTQFADKYLNEVVPLMKSIRSETIRVNRWKRQFGTRPLGQITRSEIEAFQRETRLRCKPATVNRELCRLRHMLNKAIEWELLEDSPMKGLKFLRENNARQRYLTLEEARLLLNCCYARHLKATVTVALHTGMRMGEILSMRHQDLDFGAGFILIPDSKNGEARHVPMDSELLVLLKSYPHRPGTDLVFSNRSGERYKEVRQGFQMARERAGLQDLHFHDLRHTFASHWMMNGGDLYVLKEILGHKSIAMTQRYAHLSPAYKRDAVNRIDSMWKALRPASEAAPSDSSVTAPSQNHVNPEVNPVQTIQ